MARGVWGVSLHIPPTPHAPYDNYIIIGEIKMNFSTGLIIGLLAGWLIEWIIDWFFWRRGDNGYQERLATAEAEARRLQVELADKEQVSEKLAAAEAEISHLRDQLAADEQKLEQLSQASVEIDDLRAKLAAVSSQVGQKPDHLERISGIGPTFAKRFNNAGIRTFADLAGLTSDSIREIIDTEGWQKIDPEAWIAEAGQLAGTANRSVEEN